MELPEDFYDASVLMMLTNGEVTLVDFSDYKELSHLRWSKIAKGYCARTGQCQNNRYCELLHRRINNTAPGFDTDHINTFRLDNRKKNLRDGTRSQNNMNQIKKMGTTSRFKGVSWDRKRNKWQVGIKINGVRKGLGRFENEAEASAAYQSAAGILFGDFSRGI